MQRFMRQCAFPIGYPPQCPNMGQTVLTWRMSFEVGTLKNKTIAQQRDNSRDNSYDNSRDKSN